MWEVSSTGISTVSKPHLLNVLKSFVLSLVKGEVNRKVLMPNLIMDFLHRLRQRHAVSKDFRRIHTTIRSEPSRCSSFRGAHAPSRLLTGALAGQCESQGGPVFREGAAWAPHSSESIRL